MGHPELPAPPLAPPPSGQWQTRCQSLASAEPGPSGHPAGASGPRQVHGSRSPWPETCAAVCTRGWWPAPWAVAGGGGAVVEDGSGGATRRPRWCDVAHLSSWWWSPQWSPRFPAGQRASDPVRAATLPLHVYGLKKHRCNCSQLNPADVGRSFRAARAGATSCAPRRHRQQPPARNPCPLLLLGFCAGILETHCLHGMLIWRQISVSGLA